MSFGIEIKKFLRKNLGSLKSSIETSIMNFVRRRLKISSVATILKTYSKISTEEMIFSKVFKKL